LIQASSYTVYTTWRIIMTHERSSLFAWVSVEQTSVLTILLVTLTLFFKWLFLGFSTPLPTDTFFWLSLIIAWNVLCEQKYLQLHYITNFAPEVKSDFVSRFIEVNRNRPDESKRNHVDNMCLRWQGSRQMCITFEHCIWQLYHHRAPCSWVVRTIETI
jgi:hypothetical protein